VSIVTTTETSPDKNAKTVVGIRELIFGADDIESELLDVPQWGVKIDVRSMDGKTRARLLRECMDENGDLDYESLYPQVIIATAFDPTTGEKIFGPEDQEAINSKSGAALELVASCGMRVSGMDKDAAETAGKGSSTTPSDGSSTS
jgi:hypothetical protein